MLITLIRLAEDIFQSEITVMALSYLFCLHKCFKNPSLLLQRWGETTQRESLSHSQQAVVLLFTVPSTRSTKLLVGLAHTHLVVLPNFFFTPTFPICEVTILPCAQHLLPLLPVLKLSVLEFTYFLSLPIQVLPLTSISHSIFRSES